MQSKNVVGLLISAVFSLGLGSASAQEKLVVSLWGGNWLEGIERSVGKRFTEQTGMELEVRTGGSTSRLNEARVAGVPSGIDVTLTTSHSAPLYVDAGLVEKLDMSKLPNAKELFPEAIRSEYCVGLYTYLYTIGYLPDSLPAGFEIDSWEDLWDPQLENKVALPDFDGSHIVTAAAILSGGNADNWEVGIPKLTALKPNVRMLYSSDSQSQEAFKNGETPVQVMLSINGFHIMQQGVPLKIVIPKEGGVVGIDSAVINKGTTKLDAAHAFINIALDAEVQKELAEFYKAGPVNKNAVIDPQIASLPGVMTTPEQWAQAILIDDGVRAENLSGWIAWVTENLSR